MRASPQKEKGPHTQATGSTLNNRAGDVRMGHTRRLVLSAQELARKVAGYALACSPIPTSWSWAGTQLHSHCEQKPTAPQGGL